MRLPPFAIEEYYARFEFTTRYMLSSSDCESVTIGDLLALEPGADQKLAAERTGYTESPGARELREAIAAIYARIDPDEVVVCSCAEEAIFLIHNVLLGPGDHAVIESPCYGSALDLARGTGADVGEWRRRYVDGWRHDLDELGRLIRPGTRVLYVNQPHNPTGTLMNHDTFHQVAGLARERGVRLFSDEVYRELEHDPADRLPAACDLDEDAVSLGSVSKTYGLAGLRIGWIATRDADLRGRLISLKHYTTICSSGPSEFLAALALRHRDAVSARNVGIVRSNLPLLDGFFERHADRFGWVRPTAGSIGFPVAHGVEATDELCEQVARECGVLLLPGFVHGEPRHVRVGFGRANMPEALALFEEYLERVPA
jgi:aspartate/methionine/tyrosine aminotransferase